jgi:hypothetical protein
VRLLAILAALSLGGQAQAEWPVRKTEKPLGVGKNAADYVVGRDINLLNDAARAVVVGAFVGGEPEDGALLVRALFPYAVRFPVGLTGSRFYVGTNPTATATLTLNKRTAAGVVTAIGTVSFSTSGTPSVSFASIVDFAAGDSLEVVNQGLADATAADLSLSVVGERL